MTRSLISMSPLGVLETKDPGRTSPLCITVYLFNPKTIGRYTSEQKERLLLLLIITVLKDTRQGVLIKCKFYNVDTLSLGQCNIGIFTI